MEGQPWGLDQWWCIGLAWGWHLIIGCWSRRPGAFNCSSTCHPTYPTAFVHRIILAYNHSGVKANLEFERLSGCGRLLYYWCQVRLSTWARRSRPVVNLRFLCLQANCWLDIGLGTLCFLFFCARFSVSFVGGATEIPPANLGALSRTRFATILALTPLDRRWPCPFLSPIVISRDAVPRFLKYGLNSTSSLLFSWIRSTTRVLGTAGALGAAAVDFFPFF